MAVNDSIALNEVRGGDSAEPIMRDFNGKGHWLFQNTYSIQEEGAKHYQMVGYKITGANGGNQRTKFALRDNNSTSKVKFVPLAHIALV